MKRLFIISGIIAFLMIPISSYAEAPSQIGGFVLGEDISAFKAMLNMDTALPIRYTEYIHEVEIGDVKTFKSGLIAYGTCFAPNKILRIKLKYLDPSKKFYEKLLSLFKKRFGEPSEWRGDPFHIVLAWKWSFKDKDNNSISLTLQHNTKDTEEKLGNSVKLTASTLMEKEHACFQSRNPNFRDSPKMSPEKSKGPMDWEPLVPR